MSLFSKLSEYINIITWGLCLCIGYVLKNIFSDFPNKYIPLVMFFLGIFISIIIHKSVNVEILLEGMLSGLSSTGTYELYKNWQNINHYT